MYRELIADHSEDATFANPASRAEIAAAGESLGVRFPDELSSALTESNGIRDKYGVDLLWPISRIVADNQSFRNNTEFRQLYMPFENLLFFADVGNGDQFAFVILDGEVRRDDIFIWNHEDDSRTWVAPSLRVFYEWWLTGRIEY